MSTVEKKLVMPINNLFDTMVARREVRVVARQVGFNLHDQTSIALAAWSLSGTMGLGSACQGEIVIKCLQDGERSGIRIICTTASDKKIPKTFGQTERIVDELKIKTLPSEHLEVTAIKWKTPKKVYADNEPAVRNLRWARYFC